MHANIGIWPAHGNHDFQPKFSQMNLPKRIIVHRLEFTDYLANIQISLCFDDSTLKTFVDEVNRYWNQLNETHNEVQVLSKESDNQSDASIQES